MKRSRVSDLIFIVLWLLAALGALGEYWLIGGQTALAQGLGGQLEGAVRALDAGDWALAREHVVQARDQWERARPRLALYTGHAQLQAISEALLEAETLLAAQSTQARSSLALARDRLRELPERQRPLLDNIF